MSVVEPKLCECGCGQPAPIATQTHRAFGHVKGEPMRFVRGHASRKPRPLCACGCGKKVKDSRARWLKGHDRRLSRPDPNPRGVCLCGCGTPTPLAAFDTHGNVKGKPVRYLAGHYGRLYDRLPLVDPTTGCLLWRGSIRKADGRPVFSGRMAYRVVWEYVHGPLPATWHLHHTCENPACINLQHLEPLSPKAHSQLHGARRRKTPT